MRRVLAALDGGPSSAAVLAAARGLAASIGASVEAIHVRTDEPEDLAGARRVAPDVRVLSGDPVDALLAAADDPEVGAVVVGARATPAVGVHGHATLALATRATAPVLVVPTGAAVPPNRFERVLVPLEGTRASTDAVAATVRDLVGEGVAIVVAHVFHPASTPRFWDQAGHATQTWSVEFLSRWCDEPGVELRVRGGAVAGSLLDVARQEGVDLIALGWGQDLRAGHAAVVQEVVAGAGLPVLLAPVRTAGGASTARRGSAGR